MIKANTYIVCNSSLVPKLKTISEFKLDLGKKGIVEKQQVYVPDDIFIQEQYVYHNSMVNLCGYIGSLRIYTKPSCTLNKIYLYNEKNSLGYDIDMNMSLYDNINIAFDLFFKTYQPKQEIVKEPEINLNKKEEVYIKPNKSLKDMTEAERILYARNLK